MMKSTGVIHRHNTDRVYVACPHCEAGQSFSNKKVGQTVSCFSTLCYREFIICETPICMGCKFWKTPGDWCGICVNSKSSKHNDTLSYLSTCKHGEKL